MKRRHTLVQLISAAALATALTVPAFAGAATFTSTTGLGAPPQPSEPSTIEVSGLEGTVTKVRATLNSVDHGDGTDMDVLLVGPANQSSLLMSDACTAITNRTFIFDDSAAGSLGGSCPSGTYKPTNLTDFGADGFTAAPPGPYQTGLAIFNNKPPNGTWKTFLSDDELDASGGGFGSWTLEIETSGKAGVKCAGQAASFVGSPAADVIRGTPQRDIIAGLGGDDKISGLRGNDLICGGDDDDKLNGGPGRDRLLGEVGTDKCVGGPKKDTAVSCEKKKKI